MKYILFVILLLLICIFYYKNIELFNNIYFNDNYTISENKCINNWINNNKGMSIYLNKLNTNNKKFIINTVKNIKCK